MKGKGFADMKAWQHESHERKGPTLNSTTCVVIVFSNPSMSLNSEAWGSESAEVLSSFMNRCESLLTGLLESFRRSPMLERVGRVFSPWCRCCRDGADFRQLDR